MESLAQRCYLKLVGLDEITRNECAQREEVQGLGTRARYHLEVGKRKIQSVR